MRTPLAIFIVLLALALAGCGCSGPTGVSLAELEKTTLKGLPSPIDVNIHGSLNPQVDAIMLSKGIRPVVKQLPDSALPDGSSVSIVQSCYWNAVVLDSSTVPPEQRGKVAHFFYEQIRTSKKGRSAPIVTNTEAFRWELPAKE